MLFSLLTGLLNSIFTGLVTDFMTGFVTCLYCKTSSFEYFLVENLKFLCLFKTHKTLFHYLINPQHFKSPIFIPLIKNQNLLIFLSSCTILQTCIGPGLGPLWGNFSLHQGCFGVTLGAVHYLDYQAHGLF